MFLMYSAITCPICTSQNVWKAGIRVTQHGDVQRYQCRECGRRFSDSSRSRFHTVFNRSSTVGLNHQIGVQSPRRTKNLVKLEPLRDGLAGATTKAIAKGKIVEYSFWLLKQGYAKSTIEGRTKLLKRLIRLGADLADVESVKEFIAKQNWSLGRKSNAVDAYSCFLRMINRTWEPPRYKRVRKLPFIPTENEVDQIIAGCGRKTATVLQLLKETGMRIGEAWRLKWNDVDFVSNTVRVTPEKGSNPRILKISNKLIAMLNTRQQKSKITRVFGNSLKSQRRLYSKQRRKIAYKLQNPRILNITFHTFRHFKATMEYHKTKDILHVMQLLGHRNIHNTLMYTQLVNIRDDEFVSKVAKTVKEACQLIEAGFEYVTDMDGMKIFRKRK